MKVKERYRELTYEVLFTKEHNEDTYIEMDKLWGLMKQEEREEADNWLAKNKEVLTSGKRGLVAADPENPRKPLDLYFLW